MSSSGISWPICKSAPRSRQITTPATHHSVFYRPDALPAAQPTASKHWRQFMPIMSSVEKLIRNKDMTSTCNKHLKKTDMLRHNKQNTLTSMLLICINFEHIIIPTAHQQMNRNYDKKKINKTYPVWDVQSLVKRKLQVVSFFWSSGTLLSDKSSLQDLSLSQSWRSAISAACNWLWEPEWSLLLSDDGERFADRVRTYSACSSDSRNNG